MERILVIEDDTNMKEELMSLLRSNGYQPVEEMPCDLALLDVNLPGESGFLVCQKLRQTSNVPVIFLTARDSAEDELLGFGVGADDYIRKPYNSSVLLARITRILKRKETLPTVRGLSLNISVMKAEYQGNSVELTKNETRILAFMMKKDLCTKMEIVEDLWLNNLYLDENALYVNISRLRDKLASIGANEFIQTVRGVGYRL